MTIYLLLEPGPNPELPIHIRRVTSDGAEAHEWIDESEDHRFMSIALPDFYRNQEEINRYLVSMKL